VVSYSGGNHLYNKDPYRFTHPGFQILSITYDGFTGGASEK